MTKATETLCNAPNGHESEGGHDWRGTLWCRHCGASRTSSLDVFVELGSGALVRREGSSK